MLIIYFHPTQKIRAGWVFIGSFHWQKRFVLASKLLTDGPAEAGGLCFTPPRNQIIYTVLLSVTVFHRNAVAKVCHHLRDPLFLEVSSIVLLIVDYQLIDSIFIISGQYIMFL